MGNWKLRDKGLLWIMVLTVGMFFSAPKAHAYLDPGTGSFLLQMLVAALVGCAVFFRTIWARVSTFFNRSKPDSKKKA